MKIQRIAGLYLNFVVLCVGVFVLFGIIIFRTLAQSGFYAPFWDSLLYSAQFTQLSLAEIIQSSCRKRFKAEKPPNPIGAPLGKSGSSFVRPVTRSRKFLLYQILDYIQINTRFLPNAAKCLQFTTHSSVFSPLVTVAHVSWLILWEGEDRQTLERILWRMNYISCSKILNQQSAIRYHRNSSWCLSISLLTLFNVIQIFSEIS